MNYLKLDQILDVYQKSVERNLLQRRDVLMSGFPKSFTFSLAIQHDPAGQLLYDLNEMNSVEEIAGGIVPIEHWLRNASFLLAAYPEDQSFFRALADEVASKHASASPPKAKDVLKAEIATINEEVIFVNDMVPFGFLAGARRTGASVGRMIVPRFEGGVPTMYPLSAEQMRYYGTGWLIGSRHIITNHHVINARGEGENDASSSDFEMQAKNTTVQFDYDFADAAGDSKIVSKLVLANKDLDFAILELADDPKRDPLELYGKKLVIPNNSYVPVNVIQHPGGAPKQMGIRNNLIAKLVDNDLAYFTDTKGGSSGSPVCNDFWQVVALHRACTAALGNFKYQGKETAIVNIGTRIDRIIAFLQDLHPEVWQALGAKLSM
jgi:endonuclease G, mitochondrial